MEDHGLEKSDHTVDLTIHLIDGHAIIIRVDKRESADIAQSTAAFLRVWSVTDHAWTHINRNHVVRVTEPKLA